ncbi:docking domain of Afi1 for Arf3 in vesicle trafficking-domain-containing protein [Piptocephalis cylindrospora]|uniref:Docking domain of Afi1 for Arf3 in vesicle trafficking-domain-containing protein n=1 Tax=Piptocephalis cylindrospora TaxID=1907219 RepID=A0A4P9Y8D3_9FUNG|nr:docking domain of Afi1 for Arf3 in vesicle trafficking-domain-containing protein [Piptocephalis cylindrospora]|eukprot:RKP15044.1 docking domain of Afi1 for Arf3 in vesicle trafficking-domain-containing protein [Piptocephalis cylindrospora]
MSEPHVQGILLAEFDIDKGASLTYQYPKPTGTDEHVLAELMLPDGAHLREEDWTVFFLNQQAPSQDAPLTPLGEKPPLVYVLNLVRTKHDASARRGAMVKALAICTKHQYLDIYKPILLLALESYFSKPSEIILEDLYAAVNEMDLSLLPEFTPLERRILRASSSGGMFEEKFLALEKQDEKLLDLTSKSDNPTKSPVQLVVRNKDRHFFETSISYSGIRIPIRIPLTLSSEEVGDFSLIKLFSTFGNTPAKPFSGPLPPELMTDGPYTHPIIVLLNSLLTQRRVLFLGAGRPSGEVAQFVLAACALGSGGSLRGFTERAFPYTNLTNIDQLLEFPGFIAGVTNSIFENHPTWWDILCNINTGKIIVSKDIEPLKAGTSIYSTGQGRAPSNQAPISSSTIISEESGGGGSKKDRAADSEMMAIIQSHYGENALRARTQEYIARFIQVVALHEETSYGHTDVGLATRHTINAGGLLGSGVIFVDDAARARELRSNRSRIEAWRGTLSHRYRQEDFHNYLKTRTIEHMDVERQLSKLRMLRSLRSDEVEAMYGAFLQHVHTEEQIRGGLKPIATGLFHPSRAVRDFTVEFLERINAHTVSRLEENVDPKLCDLSSPYYSSFSSLGWSRLERDLFRVSTDSIA